MQDSKNHPRTTKLLLFYNWNLLSNFNYHWCKHKYKEVTLWTNWSSKRLQLMVQKRNHFKYSTSKLPKQDISLHICKSKLIKLPLSDLNYNQIIRARKNYQLYIGLPFFVTIKHLLIGPTSLNVSSSYTTT